MRVIRKVVPRSDEVIHVVRAGGIAGCRNRDTFVIGRGRLGSKVELADDPAVRLPVVHDDRIAPVRRGADAA